MSLSLTPSNSLALNQVSTLKLPGAEITAFDPGFARLWVTSGSGLRILNFSDPANPAVAAAIDFAAPPYNFSNDVNSVAIKNGIVAVAVNAPVATNPGKVFLFSTDGGFITSVDVGAVPDNLVFTPDGSKILVANEGESNLETVATQLTSNPEGSISIIDISGGAASPVVQTAGFTAFNSQAAALISEGVRLMVNAGSNFTGAGTTVAQDLEPEYIAISPDGTTAFVTLQEANSIAIVDIATATVTDIVAMGLKDWSGLKFDASDQDGGINLQTGRPVFGIYQPDAIASFSVGGQTYYITANEGDDRNDFITPNETIRVGAGGYDLNNTLFPNEAALKANASLGRLNVSNLPGLRGDTVANVPGDVEQIISYGARSFSILDSSGAIIFDSGSHIDEYVATASPGNFDDGRSDDKGSEPEAVTTAVINGRVYAFVGLERFAGSMVYDVTNPTAPVFVTFASNPAGFAADNALQRPEGGIYISAEDSPTGRALYIVSNEGTGSGGSLVTYQVDGGGVAGTAGNDTLMGTALDETLWGRGGNDVLNANDGNDTLIGGEGADTLNGGDGVDTASYAGSSTGVTVNLSTGRGSGGDAEGDRLNGIEALTGSAHADKLNGSANDDRLDGGAGDDVLVGARGSDVLIGGAGNDVLTGGAGGDIFRFDSVDDGSIDIITDFSFSAGDTLSFGDGVTVAAVEVGFVTTGATANGIDLGNGERSLDLVLTLESAAGTQTVHILDAYGFASNAAWETLLGLDLTYPQPLPAGTDLVPIA